jgi:hypothetical protein
MRPHPGINHARQRRLHHLHRDTHIHVVGFEQVVQVDGSNATEPLRTDIVDYRINSAVGDDLFEHFRGRTPIAEVDLVALSAEVGRRCPRDADHVEATGGEASCDCTTDTFDAPVIRTLRFVIIPFLSGKRL